VESSDAESLDAADEVSAPRRRCRRSRRCRGISIIVRGTNRSDRCALCAVGIRSSVGPLLGPPFRGYDTRDVLRVFSHSGRCLVAV